MIEKKTVLSLHYFDYKAPFTGSYQKMCYRIIKKIQEKEEGKTEACLSVALWEGPYAYDYTDKAKIVTAEFPFSDAGKDAAVDWMNEMYQKKYEMQ